MSDRRKPAVFNGVIQPWGNSLGVRITRAVSELSSLGRGDRVILEVRDEGVLIRRRATQESGLRFSEDELLEGLTPHKAHADELPRLTPSETDD